ncbi:MAG: CoA pyrophosphatase [Ferruginibacter sp.]|nr:CoA pyrophosphatase [Cytophagales bacterium]
MESRHEHFFAALARRLSQPLPGAEAHRKMASSARNAPPYQTVPNERTRQSGVLLLLYPYQGEVFLPLILRPAYEGIHGGQMAFPGGGQERQDKTLIGTALREAQEEIGIKASDVHLLGILSELYIPPSNYQVLPVVGYLPYRPEFFPDPREVADVIEVGLDALSDVRITGTKEMRVRDALIQAPFYLVNERTVWGATAMILSEFLVVLNEVAADSGATRK